MHHRDGYVVCEDCGLVHRAVVVDVEVGLVGHYHCGGYAHECTEHEVLSTKVLALQAALLTAEREDATNERPGDQ